MLFAEFGDRNGAEGSRLGKYTIYALFYWTNKLCTSL